MEYLGFKIKDDESWVVDAFIKFMNYLEEEIKKQWNEEQKRLLFCSFYSGAVFGGEVQRQKEGC